VLLASIDRVTAPTHVRRGAEYQVHFTASLADQHLQVGRVEALLRGNEVVLIPALERLPGKDLLSRWKDADYLATLRTDRLAPGRYIARLVAAGQTMEWTFTVE
jgi:hypothetical protein